MSPIVHVVFALAYIVTGLTVAITLPHLRPGIEAAIPILAGVSIALFGGLVHEVITRLSHDQSVDHRLTRILRVTEDMAKHLAQLRKDVTGIKAVLEAQGARPAPANSLDDVVSEMKLLQSLVGRLSSHSEEAGDTGEATTTSGGPLSPSSAPQPLRATRASLPDDPSALGPIMTQTSLPEALRPHHAEEMSEAEREAILDTLRDALRNDRIDIYLQPIVSLPQRKHRFYEVFTRIYAGDGQVLQPDQYLDVAEKAGLIATIDNYLLVRCLRLIRETDRRQHPVGFFCNVSAATLHDADFMRQFVDLVSRHPSLCPKLVFELSQIDLLATGASTFPILGRLARLGLRFSMDQVIKLEMDFDRLVQHDFRFLKLDCGRLLDPSQRLRVQELRRKLEGQNVDVVAEKIETETQLLELLDMRIDFGQGYLFGEPRLSRKPQA